MSSTTATEPSLHPVGAAGGSLPRRTLLVVDDEEGPRQSLRIVFKDEFNVLLAENGARAVELAAQNPVDAAVLDIRMAGMSGIEVLDKLKQIDPAIEIIMLTAYETVETARQALRLGACDYLTKPFDLATIRASVNNAIERRTLSEEIRLNNQKLSALQEEIRNYMLREEIARTKGDIYASIIHDINGPLTVISGFIDIINQDIGGSDRLEGQSLHYVKGHLAQITRQVNKCIEISRRYLGFMRRRAEEDLQVSVNQILSDIGELLRVHRSSLHHELQVRLPGQDLLALINGTDLIQVLLNLSVNAFQCTPAAHRVEIAGTRLDQPLDLAQLKPGPHDCYANLEGLRNQAPLVAFTIRDNGPGIAPENMARMFKSFFTTKPAGEGTGLGLEIVLRFVKEAHGAIHVHSAVGEGTQFTVYLPARLPAPPG